MTSALMQSTILRVKFLQRVLNVILQHKEDIMKRSILVLGLLPLFFAQTQAQFRRGDFELTLLGSSGSSRVSHLESNRPVTDSREFFHISIAPAFYIGKGIALEPEVGYAQQKDETSVIFALGNLSYTYLIPNSRFAPFVRAGCGISRSLPLSFFKNPVSRLSEEHTAGVINLGAGVKILLVSNLMVRAELNHRSYRWFDRISGIFRGSPFGSE